MCDRYSGGGREPRGRGGVVTVPGDLELSDSDPEDPGAGPPLDAEVKEVNSSSDDEEEVATVRSGSVGRPSPSAPLSNFSLKGGSSSFSFRSRSIFDCLDGVAKETASEPGQDDAVDGVFARPTPPPPLASGKKPGGPQAGRKRHVTEEPGAPAPVPVRRGTPDYLLHPERWTRYSLEEVAETSDSRNRSVALQYLLSLQQSKEQGPGPAGERFLPPESSVGPSPHRIIFSRPGRGAGREERADGGRAAADGGGRKGGLSHLQEEEEDEEEEGENEGEDLDTSPAAVPPKAEQRKRKWGHGRGGGGGVVEEMEEEEDDDDEKKKVEKSEPEVPPEFASFRKAHRKNYRKTSEQEDE
ncbi:unnamed protein product [Lota lota]